MREKTLTKREQLILEATKLFTRRGYVGVSTVGIARGCGTTQPLVHYHFASKEALYLECLKRAFTPALIEAISGSEEACRLALWAALDGREAALRQHPELRCLLNAVILNLPTLSLGGAND